MSQPTKNRFRFSLRTLLLTVLLTGSILLLVSHWGPWSLKSTIHFQSNSIYFFAFSGDEQRVICFGSDRKLSIWDIGTSRLVETRPFVLSDDMQICIGPDGPIVALLADDMSILEKSDRELTASKRITVWNIETKVRLRTLESAEFITHFHLSPDGRTALIYDSQKLVWSVWDVHDERKITDLDPKTVDRDLSDAAFSKYNTTFATFSGASQPQLWTIRGEFLRRLPFGNANQIHLSPDGQYAIGVGFRGVGATLLSTETGTILEDKVLTVAPVSDCSFSDDSKYCFINEVVMETSTGKVKASFWSDSFPVLNGAFFPDSRRFLTSHIGHVLMVSDLESNRVIARLPTNPVKAEGGDPYKKPIISKDGNAILSPGKENSLLVWQRHRPEYWWGVAWLPGFWLSILSTVTWFWSVWRDRRNA